MRELELLAPAANMEIARQAILHGADAVYIGASSHGARSKATNTIADIAETVKFAHQFRARVYVTVNTLVYENEIHRVEKLVRNLYRVGVDAIIVQDMGLLRMDLPPIELHASTQCDTRTVEKAKFLEDMGFSQIVLARELSLKEIHAICQSVTVPVECFVHGALCVSYSGRCQASELCLGRSANRGECGQMCRLPYSLTNSKGETILKDRYLLSLSDFNASASMADLIEAGVSSFKIEGRMKEADYVKNVTAAYRKIIDDIIAANPEKYRRSSKGRSEISFTPQLDKSFNRGFTDYFLNGRGSQKMASFLTPKSLGEKLNSISQINNGDGVSYFDRSSGSFEGLRVNRIENGRILSNRKVNIPKGVELRRTFDVDWQKKLAGETAIRKIDVDIELTESNVTAKDERGVCVTLPLDAEKSEARKPMEVRHIFEKLGTTIYRLRHFENRLNPSTFIPASALTKLRRDLVEALDKANETTYPFTYRRKEKETEYISDRLSSADNVANSLAQRFYSEHGVKEMEKALEVQDLAEVSKKPFKVMTTRYCLRRELGCCKKNPKDKKMNSRLIEPLFISTGRYKFQLDFNCADCEMNVISLPAEKSGRKG